MLAGIGIFVGILRAHDLGNATAKVMGPDGPVDDKQKYLIVWKKMDGNWKAIAGSFSSDLS